MKNNKLLCLNVYYAPNSFGGATVVAEELNKVLIEKHGWDVLVISTTQEENLFPYQIRRHKVDKVNVITINLPKNVDYVNSYVHDRIGEIVLAIADSYGPDIVHGHAIQNIGASYIEKMAKAPYKLVITAHDCWWFCERLFMINNHGKYCFQKAIDPSVCLYCVNSAFDADKRRVRLKEIASDVDLFLYPSNFHKGQYLENGWPQSSKVNKNGVKFPKEGYEKVQSTKTRFGFVGGPGFIKGGHLIKKVFEELEDSNYTLTLVDAGEIVGNPWRDNLEKWKIKGQLEVRQPFSQDTMDDFYSTIDVLLFPSQWKESFGLTVREALVRDVFVISTNGGGVVEDLVDGSNAIVVPITEDHSFLKSAIEECITKDWREYKNPHKDVIKNYEDQADELVEYYNELLFK